MLFTHTICCVAQRYFTYRINLFNLLHRTGGWYIFLNMGNENWHFERF